MSFATLFNRIGHPLVLAAAVALWWWSGGTDAALVTALASVLVVVQCLEHWIPAVPTWRVSATARVPLVALYALTIAVSSLLIAGYERLLRPALAPFRESWGSAVWPHAQPWWLQALLLYFLSDLIYYALHRAIHRSPVLWRVTGHGFHHAFHNLGALNAGSNHPFELILVALPLVLLASAFGARGDAVGAAGVLLLTNAILAHANVKMATPGFSCFFTASDHHRRHHSATFEESNTNYACNAIIWDRLFGTFGRGDVAQTGIGPTQPGLLPLFRLPFREPVDADTVATRSRRQR